ncbi:MAG: hypothetical protein ACK54P_05270, partial [Bacteroidota bacterium]
ILCLMLLAISIYLMLAFTRWYGFMLLFQFLVGISNAGVRVLRLTALLTRVENEIIGRSESIFNAGNIFLRLIVLSVLGLPWFSEGEQVPRAYLACGLFLAVTSVILWIWGRPGKEKKTGS